MKTHFVAFVFLPLLFVLSESKEIPPTVQVYTRLPGEMGKTNTLICHVSGFHPPEIKVDLLLNGVPMEKTNQTNLAFEENWHYYLTKHATITPKEGDKFACRVTHTLKGTPKVFNWDPDM